VAKSTKTKSELEALILEKARTLGLASIVRGVTVRPLGRQIAGANWILVSMNTTESGYDARTATLRQILRELREQFNLEEPRDAETAAVRATELVRDADAEVGECDRVAAEIAERVAQRIAAEAAAGQPSEPEADPGFAKRLKRRAKAVQRQDSAQKAHQLLAGEVATAETTLGRCRLQVGEAIAAILIGQAERLADELLAAETAARDLRRQLAGLGRLWISEGNRPLPIKMPDKAIRILKSRPTNDSNLEHPGRLDQIAEAMKASREVVETLAVDPDASIAEE
jgi:hypothetical protein